MAKIGNNLDHITTLQHYNKITGNITALVQSTTGNGQNNVCLRYFQQSNVDLIPEQGGIKRQRGGTRNNMVERCAIETGL